VKMVINVRIKRDQDPGQNLQIVKEKTSRGGKGRINVQTFLRLHHYHLNRTKDRKDNVTQTIVYKSLKNIR
jgi:hypothetical protein